MIDRRYQLAESAGAIAYVEGHARAKVIHHYREWDEGVWIGLGSGPKRLRAKLDWTIVELENEMTSVKLLSHHR
jgi:hypothetical protein